MLKVKFWGSRGTFPTDQQLVSVTIHSDRTSLLIDAGSTRIFHQLDLVCQLNAILLTHMHLDHCAMAPSLVLARIKTMRLDYNKQDCPIYAPQPIDAVMGMVGLTEDYYVWSDQLPEMIGDIQVNSSKVDHRGENSCAYCFQHGNHRIVMTGDASYSPALAEFVAGADLLICECTDADHNQSHADYWGHMTPQNVARLVQESRPRHTVLYHLTDLTHQAAEAAVLSHLETPYHVTGARDEMEILVTGDSIIISGDT